MFEDQESDITENGKEPFHEIDCVMTSELVHQSEDGLYEDTIFSISLLSVNTKSIKKLEPELCFWEAAIKALETIGEFP